MAKPAKLPSIDWDSIDVEATIDKVAEVAKREAPHIKKGLKSVEGDIGKTVKAIYDWLAGPDDDSTD